MSITATCSLCGKQHSEGYLKDAMYKSKDGLTPIHIIRDYLSGFVGGCEVATNATNEEIIFLCDLKNEIAILKNELRYNEQIVKNLDKFIRERPKN